MTNGILLLALLLVCFVGCAPQPVSSSSILSSSSVQLLDDRSAGELSDMFECVMVNKDVDPSAHLAVHNRTMQTLNLHLNGSSGTYALSIDPRREQNFRIAPGSYHVELTVPGFPPSAGSMSVSNNSHYKWTIWRREPR